MAWTASDLTLIETAIRTAMTEGVAQVSIGGQVVQAYTLRELRELRDEIRAEIAMPSTLSGSTRMGMRMVKTVPPGTG